MLYSSEQLNNFNLSQHRNAVERYLHKFYRPKEFRRLKLYEKDYLFRWMKVIKDNSGNCVYNLYEISEAKEFLFNEILLTYEEGVGSFSGVYYGPFGKLSAKQIRKDQRFFNEYLQTWKNQMQKCKGAYLVVLKPLLYKKLKELKKISKSAHDYKCRETYCYGVFFWIYYKARLYFEQKGITYLVFHIQGFIFIANIYTYCHILSRHYIPSLNADLSNTMNSVIPYMDIDNLLESIKRLIEFYFEKEASLNTHKEYLLFKINGDKYIMWIKYKKLNELSHKEGFEIRSFYKCELENDINRFAGTKEIEFDNNCYCCFKTE